jgi:RES domain
MSSEVVRYLPPAGPLDATLIRWRKGKRLHRIHHQQWKPRQFNSSGSGNARFSPIFDRDNQVIPTIYAGSDEDCALMETIFHDVPYWPGIKTVWRGRLEGMEYSQLRTTTSLALVDLGNIALRKLGIERVHLIDTSKAHYPDTRTWAETLFAQFPKAQGLHWTSRQDDSAEAVVLFEPRVKADALDLIDGPTPIVSDGLIADPVIRLAKRIGVRIVDSAD